MGNSGSERAAAFRWQNQRKAIPASLEQLLDALKRLWAEAAALGEQAYVAIQHHSFEPYWNFRAKIDEHAALVEVLRGRVIRLREQRRREAEVVAAAVDREEHEILVLTVKCCNKFCFALSANPLLPIGARETFIHEIDALNQARAILERTPPDKLEAGVLDDLDTAKMILEEIIEKSPSLTNFERLKKKLKAAADAAEPAEAIEDDAPPETAPPPDATLESASLAPG